MLSRSWIFPFAIILLDSKNDHISSAALLFWSPNNLQKWFLNKNEKKLKISTIYIREIKVGESRDSKYAILTHLKALNFYFYVLFFSFRRLKCTKSAKFRAPKMTKMGHFRFSKTKIDFTKILCDRKIPNFPHCDTEISYLLGYLAIVENIADKSHQGISGSTSCWLSRRFNNHSGKSGGRVSNFVTNRIFNGLRTNNVSSSLTGSMTGDGTKETSNSSCNGTLAKILQGRFLTIQDFVDKVDRSIWNGTCNNVTGY